MVKNKTGGNKAKKQKSHAPKLDVQKDDEQMYALVTKLLGDYRIMVTCEDGVERMGTIRGSIRKRIWFHTGMYCIVAPREFDSDRMDVIHGYSYDESKKLHLEDLFDNEETNENAVAFEELELAIDEI